MLDILLSSQRSFSHLDLSARNLVSFTIWCLILEEFPFFLCYSVYYHLLEKMSIKAGYIQSFLQLCNAVNHTFKRQCVSVSSYSSLMSHL